MSDELIKRLERRNPVWESNIKSWVEIDDVIFDHVKDHPQNYIERGDDEEPADYERRLRFARFKGELAPVLHRLVGAVMGKPPTRPTELASRWGDFIDNADGCQTHLDQFLEDRLFEAFGFGVSFILVDKPPVDGGGYLSEYTSMDFENTAIKRSVGDMEILAVPYKPTQIVDWDVDRCGELHWIRCMEEARRSPTPLDEPHKVTVYREFDRSAWRVFEIREVDYSSTGTKKIVEVVAEGVHDLGIVPLATLGLQRDSHMSFYSPMKYAYHHDISNYISDSDLQYSSWRHAHPTLIDYTSSDTRTRLTIGPGATIRRNPEYNEEVKYLDFPKSMSDHLRENKQDAVEAIRRITGIDPLSTQGSAAAYASGRSRAVSFSVSEERHLRRAARALSNAEKRVFEIAERWVSKEGALPTTESINKYRSNYPLVFTNAGTEGMIEQWLATRESINSDTFDREMQKKIVDSALGDISRDIRETIHDEVDTNELKGAIEETDALKNNYGEKKDPEDEPEEKDDEKEKDDDEGGKQEDAAK